MELEFPRGGCPLVDDSHDMCQSLLICVSASSAKPTAHLAEEWNVTPVGLMPEISDAPIVVEQPPAMPTELPAHPTEPPAPPTGLTATATNGQVVLTWDDPGDDTITGYRIRRRMRKGGNYGGWSTLMKLIQAAPLPPTTDDTVVGNARYAYRIKAINEHGLSGISTRSDWVRINAP